MQKKKGISLIVLVITIIVMIILAAAIIISLNNTGIISNANKAVNDTDLKQAQEMAQIAHLEGVHKGLKGDTLKTYITDYLKNAGFKDLDKFNIEVTDKTVNVVKKIAETYSVWTQTADRKVIKNNQILNIGDIINYDGEDTWQILGTEDGKLLIVSANIVEEKSFDYGETIEENATICTNAISELNEMCEVYGNGKGAEYARSITVEDIDKITNYDKTKYEYTTNEYKIKYGESVTYYWDNISKYQNKPYFETEGGITGNLYQHSQFVWDDGTSWQINELPQTLPSTRQKITTLIDTQYDYEISSKLSTTDKAYKMIMTSDEDYLNYLGGYWLASQYVATSDDYCSYGLRYLLGENGIVYGSNFLNSAGGTTDIYAQNLGVRAVVCLKEDTQITGSSISGWNIT